jgi:integrase
MADIGLAQRLRKNCDLLIFFPRNWSPVQGIDELSREEKRKLLDAACGMDRIILLLLFETGLDIESLISLRVSDLDQQTGELRIPPDRKLQLSSAAHSEIMQYLKSRPEQVHLLEGRCGKPVTSKWKRCVLEILLQNVGPGKH